MRHIPATVIVVLLPTAACGPGGFTAAALESGETNNTSSVPSEDNEPDAEADDGWATEDEGESDSADQGESEDDQGDGDDDNDDEPNDGAPNGSVCTQDFECASLQCYVIRSSAVFVANATRTAIVSGAAAPRTIRSTTRARSATSASSGAAARATTCACSGSSARMCLACSAWSS